MTMTTWRIGQLALIVTCLGLLALSTPQRAGAADSNPSSNGTAQVQWCESLGGTATVETHNTVGGGLQSVSVNCSGGLNGSWNCHNFMGAAPDCASGRGGRFDWSNRVEALPLTPVAGSPTTPDAGPSAAATDDDDQQDTSKGKKHKKGGKGGKGRKK